LTGDLFIRQVQLGDSIPNIVSARLVMEFADGRVAIFEAKDPPPSFVQIEHIPHDRILDREQPAAPEIIQGLALSGPVAEVLLRLRAERGYTLRYLDVPK
jgi:hypothetical protein